MSTTTFEHWHAGELPPAVSGHLGSFEHWQSGELPPTVGETLSTPPDAPPTGLTATPISSSQIDLGWVDNATNETGYVVERSLNGTSGWTQVATLAANSTTYSNTGLSE
jgi:hypothetical protein